MRMRLIAQVRSAGYVYRLSADQIIALTNAGVSQNVIRALIEPTAPAPLAALAATGETPAAPALPASSPPPQPPAAPPADAGGGTAAAAADGGTDAGAAVGPVNGVPPAAPANLDYFENELSPLHADLGAQLRLGSGFPLRPPATRPGNPMWTRATGSTPRRGLVLGFRLPLGRDRLPLRPLDPLPGLRVGLDPGLHLGPRPGYAGAMTSWTATAAGRPCPPKPGSSPAWGSCTAGIWPSTSTSG